MRRKRPADWAELGVRTASEKAAKGPHRDADQRELGAVAQSLNPVGFRNALHCERRRDGRHDSWHLSWADLVAAGDVSKAEGEDVEAANLRGISSSLTRKENEPANGTHVELHVKRGSHVGSSRVFLKTCSSVVSEGDARGQPQTHEPSWSRWRSRRSNPPRPG